jgi:hypothetical protein
MGAGSAKMDIKAGGKDTGLAIKSSGTDKASKPLPIKRGRADYA